jgi:hypothetical protein
MQSNGVIKMRKCRVKLIGNYLHQAHSVVTVSTVLAGAPNISLIRNLIIDFFLISPRRMTQGISLVFQRQSCMCLEYQIFRVIRTSFPQIKNSYEKHLAIRQTGQLTESAQKGVGQFLNVIGKYAKTIALNGPAKERELKAYLISANPQ